MEEIQEKREDTQLATVQKNEITSFKDDLMTDVREQGYYATFPVDTMDDKKLLYRARNDNELLKDLGGEPIELVGLVIDTAQIIDETVGARTVPCVHLIDKSGRVYQSSSSGVVTSACDIISSFGMPDTWGEPLQVACRETETNRGYRYKFLTVL